MGSRSTAERVAMRRIGQVFFGCRRCPPHFDVSQFHEIRRWSHPNPRASVKIRVRRRHRHLRRRLPPSLSPVCHRRKISPFPPRLCSTFAVGTFGRQSCFRRQTLHSSFCITRLTSPLNSTGEPPPPARRQQRSSPPPPLAALPEERLLLHLSFRHISAFFGRGEPLQRCEGLTVVRNVFFISSRSTSPTLAQFL